jgi:hypothetical protein
MGFAPGKSVRRKNMPAFFDGFIDTFVTIPE